jgi:transposase
VTLTATAGRHLAAEPIATLHTSPSPKSHAWCGRTLRAWRTQVLAYFDAGGVSNGGTEPISPIIENTRRPAHGFRTFDHYHLHILIAASSTHPWKVDHA